VAAALPAELAGFEVDAVVGRGSFGTVFRASRARDGGAVVAVKWVPMGADAVVAGQVRRDAEILNALQHPHVLRVLDVIEHPLGLAVVMEYACRGSLADAIATDFRLPWARMTAVAVGVADALDAAHRGGVLHCDLKPSNILLGPGGEPLVSDFGVSRWVAGEPAVPAAMGTAEYLDASVARGRLPDRGSDVYALGVVCYQGLTGRLPFTGPTPTAVLEAAGRGRRPPISRLVPDVPEEVVRVVEGAMARRACHRPGTAGELASSLRAAAGANPSAPAAVAPAVPAGVDGPPGGARSRRGAGAVRLLLAVITLVAVVGGVTSLVGAGVPWGRSGHARPARPVAVRWEGNVAQADVDGTGSPARFELGQPGDVLVLGDWSCGGREVPALYRPGTGEVFLFSGWAGPGREIAAERTVRSGVLNGTARRVRATGGGCDRVVVDRPGVGKHMRPRQSG